MSEERTGIFVTVGTQLAFDRLVAAVDAWAGERGRGDVFIQTGPGGYTPEHAGHARFVSPDEFRARCEGCSAIVAHAGMGSILTALDLGKPIVVMPRKASLGEHRNEHQLATARRFKEMGSIAVARDESELPGLLDALDSLEPGAGIGAHADASLIGAVRSVVLGERRAR